MQFLAVWDAIEELLKVNLDENESWKDDHCISFLMKITKEVIETDDVSLVSDKQAELSKALMETGLQFLKGLIQSTKCKYVVFTIFFYF